MFKLYFTNSSLDIQLTGILPGLAIVIHVEKLDTDDHVKVNVKIEGEVPKS